MCFYSYYCKIETIKTTFKTIKPLRSQVLNCDVIKIDYIPFAYRKLLIEKLQIDKTILDETAKKGISLA